MLYRFILYEVIVMVQGPLIFIILVGKGSVISKITGKNKKNVIPSNEIELKKISPALLTAEKSITRSVSI